MRKKAYRLTAYTAVISAGGFLLRWLQNIRIIDQQTGLAQRGMGISVLVVVVMALVAASFGAIALSMRKYDAPTAPEIALTGRTFLHTAASVVPVLLLAVSGVMQLAGSAEAGWTRRILGLATLLGALSLLLIVTGMSRPERENTRRVCAGLLILFGGLWLVTVYKTAATDPVVWRYAVEILAICAALMAFYHVAGYFYGQPSPCRSIFFCDLGAFLCVMAAIDDNSLADSICFAAVALLLMIWSYTIIANLGSVGEMAVGESPAPEAPAADQES